MFRDVPCSHVPGFIDGPVFSKTYGMWFFFTAGNKWYTAKYAKKMEERIFQNTNYHFKDKKIMLLSDNHI